MGFVSSIFGGGSGAGFQASNTNILQPATTQQANDQYTQAQSGIGQQQSFVNALGMQGGVGNQSNVFQQQQALAGTLGNQAAGIGPNPALAQLNQATGQNMQQQAAMQGSQRGVGANAGLLARQVGQQGAQIQQQSAGQAATMQAQQQIAAQQLLQQQQANMGNLASQQVAQQAGGLSNLNQFSQGEQGQVLGAIQGQNNANVGMQSNINSANASIASQNAKSQSGLLGGILGGAGAALTGGLGGLLGGGAAAASPFASSAGQVGNITPYSQSPMFNPANFAAKGGSVDAGGMNTGPSSHFGKMMMSKGGMVDIMVSPGEYKVSPGNAQKVAHGGKLEASKVPGKSKVSGDSLKNDTVPMKAKEGSVIVPRSKSDDPAKAAAFVKAVAMRNKRK